MIKTFVLHIVMSILAGVVWNKRISDEFAAHVGNVNCLALGHKSGRVMVSGGEDKKVNMWAVGKPTCIMVSVLVMTGLNIKIF